MKKELIFEAEKFFPECHCSSLLQIENGDLLAVWFAGTREGHQDVAIYMSKRTMDAWSAPRVVVDIPDVPLWNPVLAKHGDRIILFFRSGRLPDRWISHYCFSTDQGETFSEYRDLDMDYLGPIKNKPILMSNGIFLCPSSRESETEWYGVMEAYDPNCDEFLGKAFIRVPDLPKGIIQPTVYESGSGNLHAFFRSSMDCIMESFSRDYGASWTVPVKTQLKNPNSGIDCCLVRGEILCLVYNPVPYSVEAKAQGRTPLVLSCSRDNGKHWFKTIVLEDASPGEFSYPSIIPGEAGDVFLCYTWNRKSIAVWHVMWEELQE